MPAEFDCCPFCGGVLERGYMRVRASRRATLYWKSDERHPIKWMPEPVQSTFLGRKRTARILLDGGFLGIIDRKPPGGYCDICGFVVAAFPVDYYEPGY
jgi:hypothetical protein